MSLKDKFLTGGVLVALVLGTIGFFNAGPQGLPGIDGRDGVGASPGPLHTQYQEFEGGVKYGHNRSTSTTATSYTLLASDIVDRSGAAYDTILMTPNTGDLTLTFPASSTLTHFIPAVGDRAKQCWYNASTTAGIDIIFAAGTGIDLEIASSTDTASETLYPIPSAGFGCFEFYRQPLTLTAFDIGVLYTVYVDAD